ncbi:MAG: Ig-like domain-containing protein [Prevotella sp.]|nr:Ig-like domain-containing protein [Prevotella sp.]
MKLRIKSIITLVTMLLTGIGAFAQDGTSSPQWTVSYQYDGEASTSDATGIVECTFNGTTATIVCKPVEGNYITAEDIIVEKTVSGDKAQTREVGIDSTPITITAASTNTTPRAESSYTFTAEADPNLTYEIKANFHQLKDLDTYALIALPENTIYTYTGDAIKPEITVTASDVNLTAGTDYTVMYSDNVNAGVGSITITATTTTFYTGSKTVNFDINQADVSFWFETSDGQEAKELTTTYGATFTKPVLKMSEAGAADVIGVVYSVDNEEVATINATTGELTILKAGTVEVTAAAAEDYTNKDGSNYKADPTNTKTSYSLTINSATPTLQFSKETAEATMGAEFEAPTLTVTPEGLVPIEYESTNTEVATVDKNTGVVTLVGKGEATIKAVFPGNENYETALASYILTVSKATATLKFSAETATAIMGAEFAAPTLTVTPEGLQGVKYSSSNTNVATVNETTGAVTLVGTGEAVIKASFAGTTIYEAAEASYTLTVSKVTTTLKYSAETATATMGAEFEAPTLTVTPEGLEGITYTSSNTDAATISAEGKVTLVGKGETKITATFAGNEIYEAAEASYTLTVSKVTTTLKYSAETAEATMGAEFEAPTLTVTPEGLEGITYTSSNTDAATISAEGKVTLVGKGETKITATFAGNEIYEAAEASYTLTINQVKTELKYSTDKATVAMGAEFEAPTLTVSPEGLQGITYTSSNTNVATIAEDGKVTIVGIGETTIKASFAGNTIYEAAEASYTLTVEKGVGEGYPLWIGEIQVTEDNCENVYGDRAQTFIFNPNSKILLITNNQNKDLVIESRLDELTIYLNGDKGNKLKKVFFNNLGNAENKGKLVFTTNFNVPGSIDFKNDQGESVITGFESVEFDSKSQLTFTLPEKTTYEYKNGVMNKTVVDETNIETTTPADELSIGQSLTPIDETVTFTLNTLYLKDENGNVIRDESGEPKLPNLVNSVVKDVLITLPQSNDANSDEGISVDDSDGRVGITIETVSMTDEKVKTIAQKVIDNQTTNTGYFPGSDDFAKEFVGMTILLPASTGTIETDLNIDPGYEFHLLIAEANNGQLNSTIKVVPAGKVETAFEVAMPSYCYIYLVQTGAGTRLGKRDKAHGKVFSVGVSVTKAKSVNPPSEASGNALPASEDPNVNEETTPTPPTGITTVNSDQQTVKSGWYTLDGQKIAEPKQRGLYIKDGRKVVIK